MRVAMSRTITFIPAHSGERAGGDLVYVERSSRSRGLHVLMQDLSARASGARPAFLQAAYRDVVARYLAMDRIISPARLLRDAVAAFDAIARAVDTRIDDFDELGIFVLIRDGDEFFLLCARGASARMRWRGVFVPIATPNLDAVSELSIETVRAQQDLFAQTLPETLALYRIASPMTPEDGLRELLLGGNGEDAAAVVDALDLPRSGDPATIAIDRIRHTVLGLSIDVPMTVRERDLPGVARPVHARAGVPRVRLVATAVAVVVLGAGFFATRAWLDQRGENRSGRRPARELGAASVAREPAVETRNAPDVAEVSERALDPVKNGFALAWEKSFRAPVTSSPAVAGDAVVFGSRDGRVYAIDRDNGERVWTRMAVGGVGASPVLQGDAVIAADYGGNVMRLRRGDGAVVWKRALREKIVSTPAVTPERVVVGTVQGRVVALSLESGRVLWKFSTRGQVRGAIEHAGETFFVPSHDGRLYALAEDTGARRWAVALGGPVSASPASDGEIVVIGTARGEVVALGVTKGDRRWSLATGGAVNSGITIADGRVYAGAGDRRLYCIDAASGTLRWKFDAAGVILSRPFVGGGRVVVTAYDGSVYCIDSSSGDLIDRYSTPEAIFSSPVVVDGRVFFGNNAGRFYCLDVPRS